jgi:glycosyltransferase involved in cell wall biosynthesis
MMKGKRAWRDYRRLCAEALKGRQQAEAGLRRLLSEQVEDRQLESLVHNDLGVLLAARGESEQARGEFAAALAADPACAAARANLEALGPGTAAGPAVVAAAPVREVSEEALRVALVSLLFNWPSSGGGVMHTVGLGKALVGAGLEVRHFYAEYPDFGVGCVEAPLPLEGQAIPFAATSWTCEEVKQRFRQAVDSFAPDVVLITDAWSFKPHLALAMAGYPVLLRFDGQECLCPLNNCRFLGAPDGSFSHCPRHQLATPDACRECLATRGRWSGPLHRGERELSGVERPGYVEALRQALGQAQAVLVNNPLIEAMLSPYAPAVRVVPPGVEAARFAWSDDGGPERSTGEPVRIFIAGCVEEPFKGFAVLHQACARLWQHRQDFRLEVTAMQAGQIDAFTHSTGWLSQEELPEYYRAADICVVPSLVQEGWPIVGVEAMAAGRPVVASRIGGLQFMVSDGATGLLCEPGNAEELATCLQRLLGDPELRRRMGRTARRRFEERGSWEAVLAHHYWPLLPEVLAPGRRCLPWRRRGTSDGVFAGGQ